MVKTYNYICAADKCYNGQITHPNKSFFGFPSDRLLCETWLKNCGRTDLSGEVVLKSNGYYKLCSDHFEEKFFTDSSKRLLNRSLQPVPRIFVNNANTLLPPSSQLYDYAIDLPDVHEEKDSLALHTTLLNTSESLAGSNDKFVSYQTNSLGSTREYSAETISQALLNLDPETELHQINDLCRFCMNHASLDYLELFTNTTEAKEIREICDTLMPDKVDVCDGMPHKVCQQCVADLRTCHRLMDQFRHADQYLRAIARYSLFIEIEDEAESTTEKSAKVVKEFIKPLPKKAAVMPLNHFRPVIEGFKGYVRDVSPKPSNPSELNPSPHSLIKKNSLNFDGLESDDEPIIIRSSDNDNSMSQILKDFPLQTSDRGLSPEPNLWGDDIDLICRNVVVIPGKNEALQPLKNTKKSTVDPLNRPALDPSKIKNLILKTTSLSKETNHMRELFNNKKFTTTYNEQTMNPIKDINFEINLMDVKSLESQADLQVSYKCLQCSHIIPSYSGLVDHVIQVHQIKPVPSPFTCEECAKRFATRALLMQHIREQHLSKKTVCNSCPDKKEFKNIAALCKHKRDVHSIKCQKCKRMFLSKEKFEKHMVSRHDERLACSICYKVLSSVQSRKSHELNHKALPEVCWVCGIVVKNNMILKKHMLRHSGNVYPCEVCGKEYLTPTLLKKHKQTHLGKMAKNFICHICPKRFVKKSTLKKHIVAHSKGTVLCCNFCGKYFKKEENLTSHNEQRKALGTCPPTEPEKLLVCDMCGKQFCKSYNLRRHRKYHLCTGNPEIIQKLLDEPEEHKCDECGKMFFSKHAALFHMARKHTGETKPLTCSFCPKQFRTVPEVDNHLRVHSVVSRPFSCLVCDKSFSTKENLKQHSATHTEDKPHACPLCGATFKTRANLLVHTFNHEDAESVRPFQCNICGNRFLSEAYLKTHKTKQHSDEGLKSGSFLDKEGFSCSECGKVFAKLVGCKKHIRRMHKNHQIISDLEQQPEENIEIVTDEDYIAVEYLNEEILMDD